MLRSVPARRISANREIEIKLRVREPAKIKRRLRELGFAPLESRSLEQNTLYDFPDRRLFEAGCALRVRSSGGTTLLTFKGAPSASQRYKDREEIETEVRHPAAIRQILRRLGFVPVFAYRKRRTAFTSRSSATPGKVFYDETPAGVFLELEGSPRWIDRTARALGYSSADYVTASYIALYSAARRGRS